MRTKTRWAILPLLMTALITGLCGGCSVMPSVLSQQSVPADLPALDYVAWVQGANEEALTQEQRRLSQQGEPTSLVDKTQLAILLSASNATTDTSEKRALSLLTSAAGSGKLSDHEQDYVALAHVWKTVLNQRTAMQATIEENNFLEIKSLEKKLVDLKQQNALLQEKLDTLSTIEQQLMEREKTTNAE